MREQIQKLLGQAVERAVCEIDPDWGKAMPAVQVTRSRSPEHGDFVSSVALALAKQLGTPARDLAGRIAGAILDSEGLIERTEIGGPGFINLFLSKLRWHDTLKAILEAGEGWGLSTTDRPERTQVEFVSANPTGPLTVAHARNAVLGDVLSRLLEAVGHPVTREYYFNNAGRQMRTLGESLRVRCEQELGREAELPEDAYTGAYLEEIARGLVAEHKQELLDAEPAFFRDAAEKAISALIETSLERLGIRFDVRYNERSLYDEGLVEETLETLRARDLVFEADGAQWFRATALGLERDRVLVRGSGEATYLLADIAYHREKFRRGFERIIDVVGADHFDQMPYVQAGTAALGHQAERIEAVIYQFVNLRQGGEVVKMSTRAASFVTLDELLDRVGPDVLRYFMIERRADTHFDFDLDLASERSERNPVYKIQYAHARMCSIERLALERGLALLPPERVPASRLELPEEIELVKKIGRYPEVVRRAAERREPQEVARYLLTVATAFHTYVTDGTRHRVLSDDPDLTQARLGLVRAIRATLGNGLRLLGMQAPERM
ncbi:MAG: arginine--tRNA ligase [Myxococcales bacterium]|nr:arginine--tRNA ligase [Myxococcales bacterium]